MEKIGAMQARLFIIAITATLCLASTTRVAASGPAQKMVDRWSQGKALRGLQVALSVVDAESGQALASIDEERIMNPASGTKLLTSAAALHSLALNPSWETRVHGTLEGDRIRGNLHLIGSGDPKLLLAHLEALAEAVHGHGVRVVEGGLVLHVGYFDQASLPPAFDQKTSDAGYRASTGALASNFGAFRVTVRPHRKRGKGAKVSVEGGTQSVALVNTARTVKGNKRNIKVSTRELSDGRTEVKVSGTIGQKASAHSERKRIHQPDLWTGLVLEGLLKAKGVTLKTPVHLTRAPLPQEAGPALKTIRTRTLAETLTDINTWSNNFMAEMVLKHMGCQDTLPCSWPLAVKRVSETLVSLGLKEESFTYVNGSGLYKATMLSAAAMTTLLVRMHGDGVKGSAFKGSLAVNAQPGTLKRRLLAKSLRGKVRAKTGTLNEVVSLSGYVPTRKGRTLAFALFVNGATPKRTAAIRRKLDQLVSRLTRL